MKKSLIALMGLSLALGLSACNQRPDSPSESSLPSTPLSSDSVDSGASIDASIEGSSSEQGGRHRLFFFRPLRRRTPFRVV